MITLRHYVIAFCNTLDVNKTKTVIPRELANQDVEEVIDHYLVEGSEQAALGFISALENAYAHISQWPATGSLRYAYELDLPNLRFWPLANDIPSLSFMLKKQTILMFGVCFMVTATSLRGYKMKRVFIFTFT